VLISRTEDELKDIYNNPNSTVLEKVVSSAILKSIKRGDMGAIETILNRAYGKSKEKVEQEITINSHNIKLKFGNTEDNGGEEV
jgi:hypothetical protein